MIGWSFLNSIGDCVVYTRQRAGYKEYMHIDTENKTVSFNAEVFILKSDEVIVPQSKETNEFVKYSARYGHWCGDYPQLKAEDLEFALKALRQTDTSQTELTDRIPYDPLAEMEIKRMVEERLRQTECRTCKWAEVSWTSHYCDDCKAHNKYEPQTDSHIAGKHADQMTIDECQLFADILFDKDKQEQFLKECEAMGIKPSTEQPDCAKK